jgi:hypothetical protein
MSLLVGLALSKRKTIGSALVFVSCGTVAVAQSLPVKPGLWETQATTTLAMQLPPEMEAKIAAMSPDQQAQMRAMMGATGGGGKPTTFTRQTCVAPGTTVENMMNREQQTPGMTCTVSNKTQSASGMSFDMVCTGPKASVKGHTDLHIVDAGHVSSTTHATSTASSQGHTMNSTMDVTSSAKYVSADCGDVKPYSPPATK